MLPPIPESLVIPTVVTALLDKAPLFELSHISGFQSTDLGMDKDSSMRTTTRGWQDAKGIFVIIVGGHKCGGQRTTLWSQFLPSTFTMDSRD